MIEALSAGIDARGATIDDFRHVDGVRGSFQDQFLVHLREGEPCGRCGTPIVKMVVAGRGTYVCESCQPRPRRRAPLRRRAARPSRPVVGRGLDSLKPPSSSPSMVTWGKLIMPVRCASSTRPAGSLARLISVELDAARA